MLHDWFLALPALRDRTGVILTDALGMTSHLCHRYSTCKPLYKIWKPVEKE